MMIAKPSRRAQQQANSPRSQTAETADLLGEREVAELPVGIVNEMSDAELIRVIQAAQHLLPAFGYSPEKLSLRDRPTLEMIAHLARRACRNVAAEQ